MDKHRKPPRKHPKPKPRKTNKQEAKRPTNYELEQAIDTAERMKRYIEETEPHAKFNTGRLLIAMNELSSHLLDDEED